MRTALPIPAFARGHARRVAHIQVVRRMDAGAAAVLRARSDPNAFVEFVMAGSGPLLPKIDWSALGTGEIVMAPVGRAVSGKTSW